MDLDKLVEDVAIEINQSSMWLSLSSRSESYQEVRDVFRALEQLGYEIRVVSPAPAGELRERIAIAALNAAEYWHDQAFEDEYDPVTWDKADTHWRENGYRIADAVLAEIQKQ